MLESTKISPALHALHRLLVEARHLAIAEGDRKKLATILDCAEELPTLLACRENRTDYFGVALQGLGQEFPELVGIFSDYERGVCGAS